MRDQFLRETKDSINGTKCGHGRLIGMSEVASYVKCAGSMGSLWPTNRDDLGHGNGLYPPPSEYNAWPGRSSLG